MIDDAELADYLRGEGLLTEQEVEQAREVSDREGRSLYEVVIDHGFVDEAPVVNFASELLNVAAVDPLQVDPDPELVDLVPRTVVVDHEALPLMHEETGEGKRLVLAMRDPIDMVAMDEIAIYSEVDIRPVLAGPKALRSAIERFYEAPGDDDFASDVALPDDASEASDTGEADADSARTSGETSAASNPNSTHVGPVTSSIDPDEEAPSGYELSDSDELTFEADGASASLDPDGSLVDSDAPIASGDEPDPAEGEESDDGEEQLGRIAVKQIAVPKSEADQYESGEPIDVEDDASDEESSDPSAAETVESTGEVEAAVAQIDADQKREKEEEEEEPEDRLSALRRRLGRGDSSSSDADDDPSAFLDRLEVAAGGVDDDTRRRLRSLSRGQLLEGAVVALVEKGLLSATDILDALDE